MTDAQARALILRCLDELAPDAELTGLAATAELRQALDLDSMDIFNLVAALAEESGAEIPDADVPRLGTLDDAAAYLVTHAP